MAVPESGLARSRSFEELKPQDSVSGFTPEEARELTETVRSATVRVNDLIVDMYVGKAYLALGYSNWREFCEKEDLRLEFRPTLARRRELHYFMYWVHGMSGRAVAMFTGSDQKTVAADAKVVYLERRALDADTPQRQSVISDTRGRARQVPTTPAEDVTVEASVSDLPAIAIEDGDGGDFIDVEEVQEATPDAPGLAAHPVMPPVPEQSRGREANWPDQFEAVTRQMRSTFDKARVVMSDPRLRSNLGKQPEGRLREWTDWASELVDWAGLLDPGIE